MADVAALALGHLLMLYASANLAALWAWGSRRGVSELWLTVFGLALPVGAWAMSIARPPALWLAPASIAFLYMLSAKDRAASEAALEGERRKEREYAADRAVAAPDDGAARLLLAKAAEEEGRFDDALEHYEAAHGLSDRMFNAEELQAARDRVDASRALAAKPRGLRAHPLDAAMMALSALLALHSPARGLAPLSALLFAHWMRGDRDV